MTYDVFSGTLNPTQSINQKRGHSSARHTYRPIYCGQTAGWIKMRIGREVDISPGHTVLHEDPASPPKRGTAAPTFRPMSIVAKRSPISATAEHLSLSPYGHAVHRVTVTLFAQQQIYSNLWSHYELYVVGQHGILCEVKWCRFVTLFT